MKLERVSEIYDLLPTYIITLDPDPIAKGPSYLADLIAQCRNYLNAVGLLQHEIHREKHTVARDLRANEAAFQVSFDEYLANDERVRRLPSIEDRKATVNLFLREERQRVEDLKRVLADLEMVDKAVRHRHKELTSTMAEIKLQRSLIQDEIHTGVMYGDERVRGISVDDVANAIDETELEAALATAATVMTSGLSKGGLPKPNDSYGTVEDEVSLGLGEDSVPEEPAPLADSAENIMSQPPSDTKLPDDVEAFLSDMSDGMGGDIFSIDDV
jgi:hypothetical protein